MPESPTPFEPASPESAGEARYRALFDNSVIGIRISSVAEGGRILEANPAYQKMLGYTEEELRRKTIFALIQAEDVARHRALYDELVAGARSTYEIEQCFVRKDGSTFWGRVIVSALYDGARKPTHLIGMVQDISRSRKAQAELLTSTERLQAVLNAAVDGVILIDPLGTIQSVNPSVQRMFGYREEELLGQNVKVLMPPPWQEEHDDYLARYRATGEARIIGIGRQVEGRRRDGS